MTKELAGGRWSIDDPMMQAYPPTSPRPARSASGRDAELAKAIREGIRPDGSLIGPPMPFSLYKRALATPTSPRSSRSCGRSSRSRTRRRSRSTTSRCRRPTARRSSTSPTSRAGRPSSTASTWPGRSPTASSATRRWGRRDRCTTPRSGQGGFEFPGPWGVSVAANITSSADGLKDYTDAEIAAMITEGVRPDGVADAAADALRLAGADDAGRPRGGDRLPPHPAAAARRGLRSVAVGADLGDPPVPAAACRRPAAGREDEMRGKRADLARRHVRPGDGRWPRRSPGRSPAGCRRRGSRAGAAPASARAGGSRASCCGCGRRAWRRGGVRSTPDLVEHRSPRR